MTESREAKVQELIEEAIEHHNELRDVASIIAAHMQDLGASRIDFGFEGKEYAAVFRASMNSTPMPVVCIWDNGAVDKARELVDSLMGQGWHVDIPDMNATEPRETHGARAGWTRIEGILHIGIVIHLPREWQTAPLSDIPSLVRTDNVLWDRAGLRHCGTMINTTVEDMMKIADFYSLPIEAQDDYIYDAILEGNIKRRSMI